MNTPHDADQQLDGASSKEAARLMYETRPDVTQDDVARAFDVSRRTILRWSNADGGWSKSGGREIAVEAHRAADRIGKQVEKAGPNPSEADRQTAAQAARLEAAVYERSKVIDRHRSEWGIVRGLAGEAVRTRDNAKARLAVDVGRALKLAQDGERKAWGLDLGDLETDTIVIERD